MDDDHLSKLPSTYMFTVEHDSLRDAGFINAKRSKATGVPAVHQHFWLVALNTVLVSNQDERQNLRNRCPTTIVLSSSSARISR